MKSPSKTVQRKKVLDETAWYKRCTGEGINLRETLDEIKWFAYRCFDDLDTDKDGFLEREEIRAALDSPSIGWREKSYLTFLLRRLDDIQVAYSEEWHHDKHHGITRTDIQEYFGKIHRSYTIDPD